MPKTFAIVLGVGLAIAVGTRSALPQAPHRKQLAEKFRRDLQRATDAAPGVVGVAVVDLGSGDSRLEARGRPTRGSGLGARGLGLGAWGRESGESPLHRRGPVHTPPMGA
jgi:hypothetical protein